MTARSLRTAALLALVVAACSVSGASASWVQQATATLTAPGAVSVRNIAEEATCSTTITGTASAFTVTFEGSSDGLPDLDYAASGTPSVDASHYSAVNATSYTTATPASMTSSNGLFVSPIGGLTAFRARLTAIGSGAVTVTITCTPAPFLKAM